VSRATRIWLVVGAVILIGAVIAVVIFGGGSGPGTGGGY
jgi:hypothetical protein